jgi:uncharacterized membrane protein YdfJ with MMPL/SSD domain
MATFFPLRRFDRPWIISLSVAATVLITSAIPLSAASATESDYSNQAQPIDPAQIPVDPTQIPAPVLPPPPDQQQIYQNRQFELELQRQRNELRQLQQQQRQQDFFRQQQSDYRRQLDNFRFQQDLIRQRQQDSLRRQQRIY